MFLLRCFSGHGRYLLTHVWVGVPVTCTMGLPEEMRMEACLMGDGGQPLSKTFSLKAPVRFEEDAVAIATLVSGTAPLPLVP